MDALANYLEVTTPGDPMFGLAASSILAPPQAALGKVQLKGSTFSKWYRTSWTDLVVATPTFHL